MASGSEGDNLEEIEEPTRPVRAVATRGRKRGAVKTPARRSTRSSVAVEDKDTEMVDQKSNGVESQEAEQTIVEDVMGAEDAPMETEETEVPELDDAPSPTAVVTTSVRTGLRLKTSVSEDTPEEVEVADGEEAEGKVEKAAEEAEDKVAKEDDKVAKVDDKVAKVDDKVAKVDDKVAKVDDKVAKVDDKVAKVDDKVAKVDDKVAKVDDKVAKVDDKVKEADDEVTEVDDKVAEADDKNVIEEIGPPEKEAKTVAEGNTEPVSEDELPTEALKEPDTEAVSDDELPVSKPPVPVEIPDAEEVSEDELPPDKVNRKKKSAKKADEEQDGERGAAAEEDGPAKKKKKKSPKDASSDSLKRKLPEEEYDPTSPTSENSCDETPSKKEKASVEKTATAKKETKPKALPELEKYWKAVKDDPADFTGWTYLLQYVDQENDVEAAREAYDAFLSHYPYCYGYWRKFADYERKKGNREKCEEVFARGLKAIPLSVDLWLHYLNYCRSSENVDEDFLRAQYEKALDACGMEFRSDRLWEGYIKWEAEGKRLQNVTALYDRLLATPTQAYTTHFNNFQEHVSSNPPNKVLSVDEFLTLRQEVLQLLKQYDAPAPAPEDDSAPPGEEVDVPPGEEAEQPKVVHSDEETTALRERIVSLRRKVHKQTVAAVSARWNYEEGIKRPYFHVKPLERCQLKNWKDYLDFEIEQGDSKRTIVLFERCLIACALYEEFWIRFVRYLQTLKDEDVTAKIRDVFDRACNIHHPMKPSLHLHWSEFEEGQKNYTKAAEILHNIERAVPGMLQLAYRRINLERRRGNLDRACELYEHYISAAKNRVIASNLAIKYARFCWKIKDDIEKAMSVLRKALEKDKDCARIYLQLVGMEMERQPMDEKAIVSVLDEYLGREIEPEQKLMFAQRKVEFLEDFGSDISSVQKAHEEFQRYLKVVKDRKKKGAIDTDYKASGEGPPAKKLKTSSATGDSSQKGDSSAQSSSAHSSAPPLPPSSTTTTTSQYPPPNYSQNGGYSQGPNQSGYQSGQYTTSQPPANYNQTYSQQYNQSGDYQNYQGWGYSQTGYSGYNQGWPGYYNY